MTTKSLKKQPKQQRSQAIVSAILEGATRVLSSRRLKEATTGAIAEKAGVGIGSIYDYFPNKQSIVVALLDQHIEGITADYEAVLQACENEELETVIEKSTDFILSDILEKRAFLYEIFMLMPESGRFESLLKARRRVSSCLESFLLRRCPEKGDRWAHLKSFMATVTVLGIAENYVMLEEEQVPPEVVLQEIRTLLFTLFEIHESKSRI